MLTVEQGHKQGVQDGLHTGDQAGGYGGRVSDADGKQDIGFAHLEDAQGEDGRRYRQREIRFPRGDAFSAEMRPEDNICIDGRGLDAVL